MSVISPQLLSPDDSCSPVLPVFCCSCTEETLSVYNCSVCRPTKYWFFFFFKRNNSGGQLMWLEWDQERRIPQQPNSKWIAWHWIVSPGPDENTTGVIHYWDGQLRFRTRSTRCLIKSIFTERMYISYLSCSDKWIIRMYSVTATMLLAFWLRRRWL